jgi:zinc and cadmium transporter
MGTIWILTLLSVFIVSLISLIGVFMLSMDERKLRRILFILVSLAVGGLFGDAFIHLLPESFRAESGELSASLYVLLGIILFFILEKFLHWRHSHITDESEHIHPVGYINLIADGVHNFFDGVLIAASFLFSFQTGLATTIAVILHEIPQEIGDFGILIHSGFTRKRALQFNYLSATTAFLGAIIALIIGHSLANFSEIMIPITAGGFIYIAGSDLVPELHKELEFSRSLMQFVGILIGLGLMLLLTFIEV